MASAHLTTGGLSSSIINEAGSLSLLIQNSATAIKNPSKKGYIPLRDWKPTINKFIIEHLNQMHSFI